MSRVIPLYPVLGAIRKLQRTKRGTKPVERNGVAAILRRMSQRENSVSGTHTLSLKLSVEYFFRLTFVILSIFAVICRSYSSLCLKCCSAAWEQK